MLKTKLKTYLKKAAIKSFGPSFLKKDLNIALEPTENILYGDYSATLPFALAKEIKDSPINIAKKLKEALESFSIKEIEKIETAVPGYLNFFIKKESFQKELRELYRKQKPPKKEKKKTVIIDYSSPNIAKPMHIGHLRSTVIGESLANIYESLGYKVIRWNYLGDWGTQFGKIIAAYKLWGDKKEIEKNPIVSLTTLYQKFHQELKNNPDLEKLGQEEFKKLEKGNEGNRKLWLWFKKESLREFNRIYKILNVKFDILKGEADFEKYLLPLIKDLKKKKIAQESEGALIIPLDKFNLPPALIQKSDKATLYLTRDLAAFIYRLKKYKPDKILYVVGNEQNLHFKQLFAIAGLLNLAKNTQLEHIKFGLILDKERKKFATREGEIILLEDVLNKIIEKSLTIIKEKHPQWPNKKRIKTGQIIGAGALKFSDLREFRTSDIVFDWNKMLDFKGSTSIYLQYTYARLNKIIEKAKKIAAFDEKFLNHPLEINLIKKILEFPNTIENSAKNYAPNGLANYLLSLADSANQYYESVKVLKEENEKRRNAQLVLLKIITDVLRKGLDFLGIKTLKEI